MNKNLYKDFFGLSEQSTNKKPIGMSLSVTDPAKKSEIITKANSLANRTPGMNLHQKGNSVYFKFDSTANVDRLSQAVQSIASEYPNFTTKPKEHLSSDEKITGPKNVNEAELVNKITDYQGGVVYKLFDPSTYADVRSDIENFANKKGLQVIQNKFNAEKGVGYMRFTQTNDVGKDSQRIQGFISQLPEVLKFKFKVINRKTK